MAKHFFLAAIVIDDARFELPSTQEGLIEYLASLQDDGIGPCIVWSSLDDLTTDDTDNGPINLNYVLEEAP